MDLPPPPLTPATNFMVTARQIETGVSQGCVMSSVLFNIAIDWVLRRTVEDQRRGIRWTPFPTLDDLDFADDVALTTTLYFYLQILVDSIVTHSTAHSGEDGPACND